MALTDWDVITGKLVALTRDYAESEVTGTNTVTGKVITDVFRYDGTDTDLARAVRSYVLAINASTAKRPFVAPGTTLNIIPPATTPPTAAELARLAWFNKLELLEHRLRIKNAGAVTGAKLTGLNDSITTLQGELHTDFLAAYGTP
jgi:hypothetical protein